MLTKPKNTGDRENLKTARETRQIAYKGRIIRLVTDFSKPPENPRGWNGPRCTADRE